MTLPLSYRDFLEKKIVMAPVSGFVVLDEDINPLLKPHQRKMVQWACLGGRRALFASFGLGKTVMQLEYDRLVANHTGKPHLQVAPLGVRQEFLLDAHTLATGDHPDITDKQRLELSLWLEGHPERLPVVKFINRNPEIKASDAFVSGVAHPLICITNYEPVRDGKLDPKLFGGASLDEASCLRGLGGTKTFREFMRLFDGMAYKLVATATPSPNEFIELLAYSAFLEVMDVGQAKTRFFKRNSEKADSLTIHPHKAREFWLWVASWGLFVEKPSDLGCDDTGYDLPEIEIHWHELPSDHTTAGEERSGQKRLLKNAAASLPDAAREKRDSLKARIAKMLELRALDPEAHRVIWHDLEAEREAIQKAVPTSKAVWGSQDMDERENRLTDFAYGRLNELSTKPVIAGQGCNFQRYCWWEIFLGIGFKFNDLIQAIHRVYRFLQKHRVRIDLIYTEAERPIRDLIERRWAQHDEQRRIMTGIIREYGLSEAAMAATLKRGMGVERIEVRGEGYRVINNDCVEETARMADNSVDLIVTSIPFSTQYEYSPNYADFGHTDDNAHFWEQMDYLIPHLFRILKPGRDACIHVKDRIVPGGLTGLGFQTLYPFADDCTAHFRKAGFAFLSRKVVTTDVVRENNQTYRLGWSEQCKDGTRMGDGLPEYLLIFRKPPSDASNGYADVPVVKAKKGWDPHAGAIEAALAKLDPAERDAALAEFNAAKNELSDMIGSLEGEEPDGDQQADIDEVKARRDAVARRLGLDRISEQAAPGAWDNPDGYSRARWQLDAHAYMPSSGNRLLMPHELTGLDANVIFKLWKAYNLDSIYDFEHHVTLAEGLEAVGGLPKTFMLLPPHSKGDHVWSDITRMLSMNTLQAQAGRENHLCPLQFDIVDRCIERYSMPGETVLDPFGGLMTVPFRALKKGRKGVGIELNPTYFADGALYCESMARDMAMPDLFAVMGVETEPVPAGSGQSQPQVAAE